MVPGIGTTHGFRTKTQARAICAGVAFFRWPMRFEVEGLTVGPPERLPFHPGREGIGVSPDGSIVAAGGEEGVVRLYNGANGQLVKSLLPP